MLKHFLKHTVRPNVSIVKSETMTCNLPFETCNLRFTPSIFWNLICSSKVLFFMKQKNKRKLKKKGDDKRIRKLLHILLNFHEI